MEYALFKGFNKVGIFPNYESAKKAINGDGIYNICAIKAINGKLTILSREAIRIG
ncbi:MAG: hypothetical protein RLZZ181_422 [Pseudomonadota bacterium]|jgi:hypothetical protein